MLVLLLLVLPLLEQERMPPEPLAYCQTSQPTHEPSDEPSQPQPRAQLPLLTSSTSLSPPQSASLLLVHLQEG